METKFTPGPWRVGYSDGSGASKDDGYSITVNTDVVVRSGRSLGLLYGIQNETDARLIAAAPELLAALQWALVEGRLYYRSRIKGQNDTYCDAVDRANAALRKAIGE